MGKYQQKSLQTKINLANSLKKFMNKKDLNHITISDIVKDCNLNRNSFYYHFSDIYDLLKWTFENDTSDIIKK